MARKTRQKRRTKQWNVRVTEEDLKGLRLAAIQHGVTMSEYVRFLIAQAAKKAGIAA